MRQILLNLPMLVVQEQGEVSDARDLLAVCREYILGVSMESTRKELNRDTDEGKRRSGEVGPHRWLCCTDQAQMTAYFTHCKLEPTHVR